MKGRLWVSLQDVQALKQFFGRISLVQPKGFLFPDLHLGFRADRGQVALKPGFQGMDQQGLAETPGTHHEVIGGQLVWGSERMFRGQELGQVAGLVYIQALCGPNPHEMRKGRMKGSQLRHTVHPLHNEHRAETCR